MLWINVRKWSVYLIEWCRFPDSRSFLQEKLKIYAAWYKKQVQSKSTPQISELFANNDIPIVYLYFTQNEYLVDTEPAQIVLWKILGRRPYDIHRRPACTRVIQRRCPDDTYLPTASTRVIQRRYPDDTNLPTASTRVIQRRYPDDTNRRQAATRRMSHRYPDDANRRPADANIIFRPYLAER